MVKKSKKTSKEEIKVSGKNLMETISRLIKEGNIRHVVVKNKNKKTLFEFPLTAGVLGTMLLPVFAGLGALAAMVGECTISVERTSKKS